MVIFNERWMDTHTHTQDPTDPETGANFCAEKRGVVCCGGVCARGVTAGWCRWNAWPRWPPPLFGFDRTFLWTGSSALLLSPSLRREAGRGRGGFVRAADEWE